MNGIYSCRNTLVLLERTIPSREDKELLATDVTDSPIAAKRIFWGWIDTSWPPTQPIRVNPLWENKRRLATDATERSGKYSPRGGWDLTTTSPHNRVADCFSAA